MAVTPLLQKQLCGNSSEAERRRLGVQCGTCGTSFVGGEVLSLDLIRFKYIYINGYVGGGKASSSDPLGHEKRREVHLDAGAAGSLRL